MKRVILGIIGAFSTLFFVFSTDAGAVSVSSANVRRGFSNYTAGILVNDDNMGSKNIPFEILNYDTSYVRYLYGVSASTVPNDNVDMKFKTISVNFTIEQDIGGLIAGGNPIYSPNAYIQTTAGGQSYLGACTSVQWGPNDNGGWKRYGRSWTCEQRFSNYERITGLTVVIGNVSGNSLNSTTLLYTGSPVASQSPPHAGAYVTSYSYTITGTQDPMIAGQQTMINQNTTIIEQNTNINNNIQDLEDTMKDSNVQGDFTVSAIPAFGPIAGILNNLLELPKILFAVPACTPIRPTLPFVNQDIEIPCMSTVYAQAYPAFITFLDAITSAYIWFRVARYIVRQVQHLRDPEQEDEEYLDI